MHPETDSDNYPTQELVRELEKGIANHIRWSKNLHRKLICGLPANPDDIAPDAHCRCQFGRWYYKALHPGTLAKHKLFKRLGESHHHMHDHARRLLEKAALGQPLETADYDRFIDESIRFNDELRKLQLEFLTDQYALDPLTNLASRHGMLIKLRREQERAARARKPCTVCMVDLDYFKKINDTYGHQVGDEVLRATAAFISRSLRKYDQAFRYGGEEFLLFLPEIDAASTQAILERIRSGLEQLPIVIDTGDIVHVTGSFGVAELDPGISVEEAISRADQALYGAKDAGRNRITIWCDE